jgi:hypothetical protein
LKFYTTTNMEGTLPDESAAIVKARNKKHAAEVLTAELRKLGGPQATPLKEEDMRLWPEGGEQVRILNTKKTK